MDSAAFAPADTAFKTRILEALPKRPVTTHSDTLVEVIAMSKIDAKLQQQQQQQQGSTSDADRRLAYEALAKARVFGRFADELVLAFAADHVEAVALEVIDLKAGGKRISSMGGFIHKKLVDGEGEGLAKALREERERKNTSIGGHAATPEEVAAEYTKRGYRCIQVQRPRGRGHD